MTQQAFLARTVFDSNTRTWKFRNGSGAVPDEMHQDLMNACEDINEFGGNGLPVLGTLFDWKRRLYKENGNG